MASQKTSEETDLNKALSPEERAIERVATLSESQSLIHLMQASN
jgi:hypothetical protein